MQAADRSIPDHSPAHSIAPARDASYRVDINALRGVAVALVVLYHFKVPGLRGGFMGVDLFFVISGYLMTRILVSSLEEGRFGYWRFVAARIARIWPALAVMLIVALVAGAIVLPPDDLLALAAQVRSAAVFESNRHFRDEERGYFAAPVDESWLLHTWSLAVEWQFYMLYPLLMWGSHRFAKANGRRWLAAAVATGIAFSFAVCVYKSGRHEYDWSLRAAFFMLPSRAWELLAGGLVYFAEPVFVAWSPRRRGLILALGWALLSAAMVSAARADWAARWPGALAAVPVVAGALILAGGAGSARALAWAPGGVLVQSLGRWSYSIYLWHWPVHVALVAWPTGVVGRAAGAAIGIIVSVGLGWVSYRAVEQRFVGTRPARGGQGRWAIPAAMLGGTLAIAVGVTAADGLPWRAATTHATDGLYKSAARKDYMPDGCENFQVPFMRARTCGVEPGAEAHILVYGDSHAQHLYPWFRSAAIGADFLVSGGCPPVPEYNRRLAGFRCASFSAHALRVAALPRYRTVVFAARWSLLDAETSDLCRAPDDHCAENGAASREEMAEALASEWKRLLALGKNVVVVDALPEPGFNVPKRLSRLAFIGVAADPRFIDVTARRGPVFVDLALARLEAAPALRRASFRPLICPSGECSLLDPRTLEPVYSDDNHLAIDWVRQHGDVLRPHLAP